jgi:ABC-type uncharacterized transport system substrate-binding protein
MKRREFITLLGGAAVAWPDDILAQQPDRMLKKLPRIGFLASAPPPLTQPLLDAFDRGLREQGYVEGRNILVERRFWKDDQAQLSKFVAEFVATGVDLIVAPTTPEALAAKSVTSTIPIVTATADPVAVGLAASFARPGSNVTGLTAGRVSKNLSLLAEAVPEASRFAVLMDPGNPLHAQFLPELDNIAAQRHLEIVPVVKRSVDDIGPAFATMAAKGIQALVVLSDPVTFANRRRITELAAQNRIPAVYSWREEAVEGGLLAYGADIADLLRRSATYVAKLLQGAKAAELRLSRPSASIW